TNGNATRGTPPVLVLTGGEDSTVRLWDAATGQCLRTSRAHRRVSSLDASPDGRFFLVGLQAGTVELWGLAGGTLWSFQSDVWNARAVAFHPDGRSFFVT